jgi:hypothetical protein
LAQERKYEMKTFNENFAKKVRLPFPETWSLLKLPILYYAREIDERTRDES